MSSAQGLSFLAKKRTNMKNTTNQMTLSFDRNVTTRYNNGMFVKLFSQILDSSIADNRKLRHFFTDLLLCADADGCVMMTDAAISRRTGAPMDEVEWGLAELSKPDPRSKTPDHEGRRIERVEGHGYGWKILNYEMYRSLRDAEQMRAAGRERSRRHREKPNACNAMQKQNAEGEEEADIKSWKPSPEQIEVASWFGRKPTTVWSKRELKAWSEMTVWFKFEGDDWDALRWYYTQSGCDYIRKDLGTLLNNWSGEIDRAKQYDPSKK